MSRFFSRMSPPRHRNLSRRFRLLRLEDRLAPAAFVVTSTADTGVGTLRNQIIATNGAGGADTITFDKTVFATVQTIKLTSGEIAVSDSLTITGPAAGVT